LRPVRDLLRRRLTLVHHRTALMLSFKSLYTRTTGQQMTLGELKDLGEHEMRTCIGERGRQPEKGVGVKPSGLIGGGRAPVELATEVELLGEKF
jgi:hypothetical protein